MPRLFLELKGGSAQSMAWSPDAKVLLVGTGSTIYSWFSDSAALSVLVPVGGVVRSLSWSRDGETFAAGILGLTESVRIFMRDGSPIKSLGDQRIKPVAVEFHSSGKLLAASQSGSIHVWDPMLTSRFVLSLGNVAVTAACWHPNGREIIVSTAAGELYIVTLDNDIIFRDDTKKPISALACSSDGWAIVAGTDNGEVHVWMDDGYKTHVKKKLHNEKITAVTWSPKNEMFLVADLNGVVTKWARDGSNIGVYRERLKPVLCMQWSPSEDSVSLGTASEGVHILTAPVPVTGLPIEFPDDVERLDIEATLAISLLEKGAKDIADFSKHGLTTQKLNEIISSMKKSLNPDIKSKILVTYLNNLSRYASKGDLISLIIQFGFFRGKLLWEYARKLERASILPSNDPVLIKEVSTALEQNQDAPLLEIANKIGRTIPEVLAAHKAFSKRSPQVVTDTEDSLKAIVSALEKLISA
ncbi:MAG: hypothetical protein QXL15_01210 [Candidatus Korarchaeota archaeon]